MTEILTACHACGATLAEGTALHRINPKGQPGVWVCYKHIGRIGCQVPGCRRTKAGEWPAEWICADHWRAIPRYQRAAFHRVVKKIRRYGLTDALNTRRWRLWCRLKRAAGRPHAFGGLDEREIRAMFGWEEEDA